MMTRRETFKAALASAIALVLPAAKSMASNRPASMVLCIGGPQDRQLHSIDIDYIHSPVFWTGKRWMGFYDSTEGLSEEELNTGDSCVYRVPRWGKKSQFLIHESDPVVR
jgi:hypothetical protein